MSEKKSGKTRGYRPDTSEPPPPPDEDVVQKLLKDAEDKGESVLRLESVVVFS